MNHPGSQPGGGCETVLLTPPYFALFHPNAGIARKPEANVGPVTVPV